MFRRVVRYLIFAVPVGGIFLVYFPGLIVTAGAGRLSSGWLGFVGLLLIALGALVTVWCALLFVVIGQGTPAVFDPPRRIVTVHLYGLIRNPLYVAALLILVGEAVLFQSVALLGYAALVWLGLHLFVMLYEEPGLRRRFGVPYEDYTKQVPRWLPRLRRR